MGKRKYIEYSLYLQTNKMKVVYFWTESFESLYRNFIRSVHMSVHVIYPAIEFHKKEEIDWVDYLLFALRN
jgi:TRAP-type uncharacterized transport system fused permease subunit